MNEDHSKASPFHFSAANYRPSELRIVSLAGREALSKPFRFDLVVASAVALSTGELVGSQATLWLSHANGARAIHGMVAKAATQGTPRGMSYLNLRLVPRSWLLKRRKNSRVFQNLTTQQIVTQVLAEIGVESRWNAARVHTPREYCVQYQETDHTFMHRLLAEEGFFYWFDHTPRASLDGPPTPEDSATVVFADSAAHYFELPGGSVLPRRHAGALRHGEFLATFTTSDEIRAEQVKVVGYDYRRPAFQPAAASHLTNASSSATLEWYDHDRVLEDKTVPAHIGQLRLEAQRVRAMRGDGTSNCGRLVPGCWFEGVDDGGAGPTARHTVVGIRHQGSAPVSHEGVVAAESSYENELVHIPAAVPFRAPLPERIIHQVVETATVVGPEGEEIHTDELGRIKIQFPWDRHGERNESSSCWIRPLQMWAGAGWGTQFIPRIGMEVLVGFVGGDTDRPAVLGCQYNGVNPPPFELPAEKTASGVRTRSTPGGDGKNELIFEDAKGAEQIYVHAERDFNAVVENDHSRHVRGREALAVEADRLLSVGGDSARVINGNEVVLVRGSVVLDVTGNQVIRVGGGAAASPVTQAAVERMKERGADLKRANVAQSTVDEALLESERLRDARMLSACADLAGDHERAARILVRRATEARDAQKSIGDAVARVLAALDHVQDAYLNGEGVGLPTKVMGDVQRLGQRIATHRAEVSNLAQENVDAIPSIAPVQQLAREDLEATLNALERSSDLLDVAGLFLHGLENVWSGEGSGGGAVPQWKDTTENTKIKFDTYYKAQADAPTGGEIEGSMLNVAGAVEIKAGAGIKLTCGASTIEMTPGGITVSAPVVTVAATGTCAIQGSDVEINC